MLGIGGGILMIAVMAQILPVAALIPVHGLFQIGSNFNRALMLRQHIDWAWVRLFFYGAVIGAAIASLIVVQLPLVFIQLSVGLFVLWMIWGPKPKQTELSPRKTILAGGVTTLISTFVGVTGPLVGSLIYRANGDKLNKVATMAATMTSQHTLKVIVFSFIGFVFTEWLALVAAMIAAGALGTWIGLHVLHRVSSELFSTLFRLVITLLALRLIYQGVVDLYTG